MRIDLSVRAVHRGEMRVDVHVREHMMAMDYPAASGKLTTPLEALLASLAACAASTLNLVLSKKMGAKVESLEVEARAERRQEHPTVLTNIELVYRLRTENMDSRLIDHAVSIAEEKLCPVLAMLRPGTAIRSQWKRV